MTVDATAVLSRTDHRPYPLPARRWLMSQRWHDLLFAHWPVASDAMRALVPPALELDLFDGSAWVGVVPFRMSDVRLRGLPGIPGAGAFEELNVRTYVRVGDAPGVYFFSLDARSALAVAVARRWFRLPYFRARMRLEEADGAIQYRSVRSHRGAPPAELHGSYTPHAGAVGDEALTRFLTERYRLYTVSEQGRAFYGDIHHHPWPLEAAEARFDVNTMASAAGLELRGEPLLSFSRRLDVLVWGLRPVVAPGRAP